MQNLTYVYSKKEHDSTERSFFNLILSLHAPGPTMVDRSTALTTDIYVKISPKTLRLFLQREIDALQKQID